MGTKRWNPRRVNVALPVCSPCKKENFEVLHIDWVKCGVDLVVHRKFRRALRKQRRRSAT